MSVETEGTEQAATAGALEAASMRVLEMFGAVCADPDNSAVATAADAALAHLETLLGPSSGR